MNDKIKNILLKLEDKGYQAYVIGGFVRDYLLGIETYDVDIATSAEPKVVREIFELNSSNDENYGSVYFKDKLYNYDITTFRKELSYVDRKPVEYQYIDSIDEDIQRRDFTINCLYMDKSGKIFDSIEGQKDLDAKVIRVVGNIADKLIEDPLRILRAVRFATTLDFKLEPKLETFIKQNSQLLKTLSYTRIKEELDKMFNSPNKLAGVELLKKLKLGDILDLKIPDNLVFSLNKLGIWAQINYSDAYQFSNAEKETITKIRKIVEYSTIDNMVLYEYGLYPAILAGDILGISRSLISDMYKNLPIYSVKDIKINGDDIIKLLNIEPGSVIKEIIFDIEINILNNTLQNESHILKEFILANWR